MIIEKPHDLTLSQWATLKAIYDYFIEVKIMPTNLELSQYMAHGSPNSAFQMCATLERKGYIGIVKVVKRGMYFTDKSLDILRDK